MKHPETEQRITPVRKSVEIRRPVGEAFRIFTEEIHTWWPLKTRSVSQERARTCGFEGRVGGRLYEEDSEGKQHLWGTVLVWDPPVRVVLSWHPGRDPKTAQKLELRFSPIGSATRVELEHRGWELLGPSAALSREDYDRGWEKVLELYAAVTE